MILTRPPGHALPLLKAVRPDDRLELTGTDGTTIHYRVTEQRVLDSRRDGLPMARDSQDVIFVTCFPFDAIARRSATLCSPSGRTD